MRVITRNDETVGRRYLPAKSFVTCARRSCPAQSPVPGGARRVQGAKRTRWEERKTAGRSPGGYRALLSCYISAHSLFLVRRVLGCPACSHCASLISFKTDGYLSSHMSLKWRAQTSGTPFPFGISVLPRIRDDDVDDCASSTRLYYGHFHSWKIRCIYFIVITLFISTNYGPHRAMERLIFFVGMLYCLVMPEMFLYSRS